MCLGRRFFMIFNNFGFSHSQISKFWNGKKLLQSSWNCCLDLDEVKKRWILIKFWTGMIYGKIYDYFPMPNYSWTNGIFLWNFSCKNYFCTWQNFSKFRKKTPKIYLLSIPISSVVLVWCTKRVFTEIATKLYPVWIDIPSMLSMHPILRWNPHGCRTM